MAGPKLYGSVNNKTEEVSVLYGPVSGQTKEIYKVYGSRNGKTELIYHKNYGTVTFYTDNSHTTTSTVPINTKASLYTLAGADYSDIWTATVSGRAIGCGDIKGVTLTSAVKTLPNLFLTHCSALDTLDISQTRITTTPDSFLRYATIFNQNIVFPQTLTSIGNHFLAESPAFNSNINLSNVTYIGSSFMYDCFAFNKPLNISNVTFINSGFLRGAGSVSNVMQFNQPLDLSKVTTIGSAFLDRCRCYDQDVVLPSTITYIGNNFMSDMRDMVHTVYCNTSALPGRTYTSQTQYSLCTYGNDHATAPSYVTGIKISGTYKNEWRAECPDVQGGGMNLFRKLIVV